MPFRSWWAIALAMSASFGCGRVGLVPPGTDPSPTPSSPPVWEPLDEGALEYPSPEPPFGDGKDGDVTLGAGSTVVNSCHILTSTEPGVGVHITDTWNDAEQPGRLLLLHQVQDQSNRNSGDTNPITDAADIGDAGKWELVRLVKVDPVDGNGERLITTDPPPVNTYLRTQPDQDGRSAQVCTIPEYRNLTVPAGASLDATIWDLDFFGGVVFFYVSETLAIDGTISATAAGFWGRDPEANDTSTDQTNMDYTNGNGSSKGEGLDARSSFRFGRGNYVNAAGGGNASNAGGGGGGNGGAGGIGGRQSDFEGNEPNTRGLGGVAIELDPRMRLVLGGGGGAGQQNDGVAGAGGFGGGLIVIFANTITGSGTIEANGANGGEAGSPFGNGDGAGGGGAGGTIWIEADTSDFSGPIQATGGNGGDVRTSSSVIYGVGGGGGGGQIVLRTVDVALADVSEGSNGLNVDNGNDPHDSSPGAVGQILQIQQQ